MSAIRRKYPNRVPIIIESGTKGFVIEPKKYLVPKESTIAQFIASVRKYAKLNSKEALFFMVNNVMVPTSDTLSEIDSRNTFEDDMLHMVVTKENTFG
jgi:GABA(A) receptor-associated protein